jgi:hypothetical protein
VATSFEVKLEKTVRVVLRPNHSQTIDLGFETQPRNPTTSFEVKLGETVAISFEAKLEKTVAAGFEAKPLETVATGFEAKPAKTV